MAYFAAALVEWFKLNLTFLSFLLWQWLSWDRAKMFTWLRLGVGVGGRCATASAFAAFAESLQIVGTQNKWHH